MDWAREDHTATDADRDPPPGHPDYGFPSALQSLAEAGLIFSGTELAPDNGGLIEGALAAAEAAARQVTKGQPVRLGPSQFNAASQG